MPVVISKIFKDQVGKKVCIFYFYNLEITFCQVMERYSSCTCLFYLQYLGVMASSVPDSIFNAKLG